MDKITTQVIDWKNSNIQVFWGEIAPCDHVVQIYEHDAIFLNTLEGFVGSGFLSGDSVIVIATKEHLASLSKRLIAQSFDLGSLVRSDRYFPIDASEALSAFMVNGWPDERLFGEYISQIIGRATKNNRKVRAFGEMVALLWQLGLSGATVRLEHLWCRLHDQRQFSLYCAYPKNGFTQSVTDSLDTICKTHSKIIDGEDRPSTEIYYRLTV
jgi:hypothetical protein